MHHIWGVYTYTRWQLLLLLTKNWWLISSHLSFEILVVWRMLFSKGRLRLNWEWDLTLVKSQSLNLSLLKPIHHNLNSRHQNSVFSLVDYPSSDQASPTGERSICSLLSGLVSGLGLYSLLFSSYTQSSCLKVKKSSQPRSEAITLFWPEVLWWVFLCCVQFVCSTHSQADRAPGHQGFVFNWSISDEPPENASLLRLFTILLVSQLDIQYKKNIGIRTWWGDWLRFLLFI